MRRTLSVRSALGVPSTAEELTALGDEGILALVGDSTNVFNPEASGSETGVREGLDKVIAGHKGRVLVTTFASNAARLHTLGEVAKDTGRQICVVGRSLDDLEHARKCRGEDVRTVHVRQGIEQHRLCGR